MAEFSHTTPTELAMTPPPSPLMGARCLIVEDLECARHALGGLARAIGLSPLLAEDGAMALAYGSVAEIAIVDLHLPDMDGLDVISALQNAPGAPHVVAMTGLDRGPILTEALARGAFGVLVKPVTSSRMLEQALMGALSNAPVTPPPQCGQTVIADLDRIVAILRPCRGHWRDSAAGHGAHLLAGVAAEIGDERLFRDASALLRLAIHERPAALDRLIAACGRWRTRLT